ncbi:MAG: ABC transporter ATP-binding protein [Bacteroidetes bacterium]|nr:MAG: ABC transporter ATP-binding protein [Bacteroidota bacterium]
MQGNKNILLVNNLKKRFDGIIALDNFSCNVNQSEILGLIGPNGAGKTTLFNAITGFANTETGTIYFKTKKLTKRIPYNIFALGIARTFQDLRLIRQMTVLDNVLLSFKRQAGESLWNIFFRNSKTKRVEAKNIKKAVLLLEYAGLTDKKDDLANDLSYGQQKLLSIICCLASDAELLLLDEPVAGINPEKIKKILSIILEQKKKGKTIVLIEHNMDVVMDICDRVVFMDAGQKICEGSPETVRNNPEVIQAYLE